MFALNQSPLYRAELNDRDAAMLGIEGASRATRMLDLCPLHRPTSLVELPGLAQQLGLRKVAVKDESQRLGLSSFKALGGTYAVINAILEEAERRFGSPLDPWSLFDGPVRKIASEMTVGCASEGNHGRAVAAGAKLTGCRAVIYVPEHVSGARVEAIQAFGAEVRRVRGGYDDAVEAARTDFKDNGWTLIADTAWDGYERAPLQVMQGYTVIIQEALAQLARPPTHVFVQAGVGGLAAAVAAYLEIALGRDRPSLILVEPSRAACFFESHRAGRPERIARGDPTVMAMLDCHEPSLVAWRILIRIADAFMLVEEEDAVGAMRRLASPADGDSPVISGESGAAGMAGLLKLISNSEARDAAGLGPSSEILLFSTEGATDPGIYEALTGVSLN